MTAPPAQGLIAMSPSNSKSSLPGVLWTVGIGVLAVAAMVYVNIRPQPFDEARWKKARTTKDYHVLYAMSEDLALKLRSSKLTREEVVRMLGPADRPMNTWHRYRLGRHRRDIIDIPSAWTLDVFYEVETTRIVEVRITPD
jgi:hypothetical protein